MNLKSKLLEVHPIKSNTSSLCLSCLDLIIFLIDFFKILSEATLLVYGCNGVMV